MVGFFFISSAGWFVADWFQSRRREVELMNNQLDAELKFLKLQLNPHFLFNTLNNIYSMAIVKNEKTPFAIEMFSNLMRFVIYETQHDFVPLSRKIEYIDTYIELQKLRLSSSVTVNY